MANTAKPFSIQSVTLSPGNYVAPWFDVQVTVDIITPSQPAFLYAQTQVSSNSDGIHIDIYPDSGMLTAIGSLRETVNLGSFPIGTYRYEVVLHPAYEVNWGTRTANGAFTVVEDVPTVKLTASSWKTAEPCPTCLAEPVILTLERSDPTNKPTTVYLKVDGTATPDQDYKALPHSVEIPEGARTFQIALEPIDDDLPDGPEAVRVQLNLSSNYRNYPTQSEVLIAIFDNEPDAPTARLDIIAPTNSSRFGYGNRIPLSALAINVSNEVYGPVEFYAGDQLVARSEITASTRPPVPGLPSIHSAYWTNPPAGEYTITAHTHLSYSQSITSPPLNVIVEEPRLPIVSIGTFPAQNPQAPEFCPPNANCQATGFILRRIGPTNSDVRVYVDYSGTATPDKDYRSFSNGIVIPAGRDSVLMALQTIDDDLVEGPETVIATLPLVPSALYGVDTSHGTATITIIDDESESNAPPAIAIAQPTNHAEFPPDTSIEIVAEAGDSDGWVQTVEFFADGSKIAEEHLDFFREPDPGQTQSFTFTWRDPTPGRHVLTARAIDNVSATADSAPVEIIITVDSVPTLRVAAIDCFALEPISNNVNTATFDIHRFGPTNADLTVVYSLHGSAENGIDYETLPGTAVIPAGSSSIVITVQPIADDVAEGIETVVLRLEPEPDYHLGLHDQAVALIDDGALLPPNSARCTLLPGNCLDVCFSATTSQTFRIEASTDLRNWETVSRTTGTDGAVHFVEDAMSSFPQRFFRLIREDN